MRIQRSCCSIVQHQRLVRILKLECVLLFMQLSRATACRDSSVTIRLTAVMRKVLAISQQHASKGVYFINTIIYVSNCPTQFQNDRMFFTSKNSHIHMLLFFLIFANIHCRSHLVFYLKFIIGCMHSNEYQINVLFFINIICG